MAQSLSVGATAQIITHARFSRPPVMQTRKVGRLPKEVTSLRRYAGDLRFAAYVADIKKQELETLRRAIAVADLAEQNMRFELAQMTQGKP